MKTLFSITCILSICLLLVSCKKDDKDTTPSDSPVAARIAPDSAAGGNILTLTGSGLGDMRSIVFDNHSVPAPFNPNFNTDGAVIFRVPDTAYGGPQNIVFTNSLGRSVSVPFRVIALATISSASLYEFSGGTQITLFGNNLESVTAVRLAGTGGTATIVSQSRGVLVITMPATALFKVRLEITNASGTITTQQEFIAVDNAFQFFTEDFGASGGGIQNWSWCGTAVSTDFSKLGVKSLKATYSSGAWAGLSFFSPANIVESDYTYLTFWAKGGTADVQVNIAPDNISSGSGATKTVTIPATNWTYFKIPIAGWINGVVHQRMNFQIQGPNGGDQVIYYDNILLVK